MRGLTDWISSIDTVYQLYPSIWTNGKSREMSEQKGIGGQILEQVKQWGIMEGRSNKEEVRRRTSQ
jgi:hypothetical protein